MTKKMLLFIGIAILFDTAFAFKPIIGFMRSPSDPCAAVSPALGTVCKGGAIFAGKLSTNKYMTTPGGCADVPNDGNRGGTNDNNYYTTADFTPTCSGTDALTKYWNDGFAKWYDIPGLTNYTSTEGIGNGAINTDANYGSHNTNLISAIPPDPTNHVNGGAHAAARYCDKLVYGGYDDWYLPNRHELNLLYDNRASIPGLDTAGNYWSSTEYNNFFAWIQRFDDGYQYRVVKNANYLLRCVRRY